MARSLPHEVARRGATEVVSAVTSKGQVTLPAAVRRHLGIGTRDRVAFVIKSDGTVQVRAPRYRSVRALRGAAGHLEQPRSWEEMRQIAYEDRLAPTPPPEETEQPAETGKRPRRG